MPSMTCFSTLALYAVILLGQIARVSGAPSTNDYTDPACSVPVPVLSTSTVTTTVTETVTITAFPEFCCPSTNRIANPGFETDDAWNVGNNQILRTNPTPGVPDARVIVSDFSGPNQTRTFSQTISGLCPGRVYRFKAEIQMWQGSGTAYVNYLLGGIQFLSTQSLATGPWVTVRGLVTPTATTMVLTVNVISNGAAGTRRFVQDDFELILL
ncbi:hypothetical protein BDZ91DRAFT_734145 [Kalaharituber pfeilii]|nr:hypothetical protein BDZ91DRAFT_734145 [Kalaharituber pfeilii]